MIRRWCIGFQIDVDDQLGDEEIAAHGLVQQQAVFANPSKAAFGRPRPLVNGCGIYKHPSPDLAPLPLGPLHQFLEFPLDDVVVVLPLRIACHAWRFRIRRLRIGVVIVQQGHDGFGPWNQLPGIQSLVHVARQISHFAVVIPAQPLLQPVGLLLQKPGLGNAHGIKAQGLGLTNQRPLAVLCCVRLFAHGQPPNKVPDCPCGVRPKCA